MEELYLKKIELEDKEQVLNYIKEFVQSGSHLAGMWYEDSESYEVMLENLKRHEKYQFQHYEQQETPCLQFLLIRKDDNKMVGAVSIRPYLTKRLNDDFGGNIGYSIRPSERKKGYASMGLKLAIEKFREINPNDNIIVGCSKDNVGSRKVIVKNGGILIEERNGIITKQKYKIVTQVEKQIK